MTKVENVTETIVGSTIIAPNGQRFRVISEDDGELIVKRGVNRSKVYRKMVGHWQIVKS